jgi:hypothetical protein
MAAVQANRADTVQLLVDFAKTYRDQLALRPALAGNGAGTLDVPGANRKIYAELGAAGGEVCEAQYDQFHPNLGDAIFLTRTRVLGTGGWLVLGFMKGDELPCAS